ncbi:MAG: sodium:proton antiporter [Bacteroidetes bacterium]|uniref:Sodium:proton antiporter n=1 Tax=Phaeocystidibacter marisrubri TaxID=1577780 RepID=A0A6L3ZGC5_9FLAO|nr:sodium:proton antiporter NhaD [Phaeocystidibacter marisrubri]KAB2815989.1 sodium:proton antiporter [Phaeocystidibacter marisrubri]TNE27798.1 MAG: sodium:proton antiporter [Bacteroidota bacterium]GGH66757.1 sodium:proton antiporter [Phaeocystidibacter marisrubri]
MYLAMVVVFILGYAAIAFEHQIHIDKAASALVTGVLCWTLYVLGAYEIVDFSGIDEAVLSILNSHSHEPLTQELLITEYVTHHQMLESLSEIASILFFLIGAMTIVELVDAHEGFTVITDKIRTTSKVKLMWIIAILSFFFSAALDNLTTSIVMVSLLKKLIDDQQTRWLFAGLVVIAANAGGAWSPIGDVTTTMLWISGQITTGEIVTGVFLPSLVCLIVPLTILSLRTKGTIKRPVRQETADHYLDPTTPMERNVVFFAGVAGLLFVPVFKSITHLPPFMGMMLSLGSLWILTDILHRSKNQAFKSRHSVIGVIRKIDTPSVLFFLGILLAVGSLQNAGQLTQMANMLDNSIGTDTETGVYGVGIIIGLLSSIVDNVPLVAASMGMYPINPTGFFAQDGLFWEFLAYCAGTGGSALIIGSAAGVAVMGLERMSFGWYLKKISLLAIIGYLSGAVVYILEHVLFH